MAKLFSPERTVREDLSITQKDILTILKFLKKPTAILLAIFIIVQPLAAAFAQGLSIVTLTSTTSSSTTSSGTQSTTNNSTTQTPISSPSSQTPTTNTSPTNSTQGSSLGSTKGLSPLTPGVTPDPRIDVGNTPSLSPTADQNNGSLVEDYPLTVPPGRNGFQPDLKLQYNSQNSKDVDSEVGAGWNLNIPYIELLNKSGVDKLYSTTTPSVNSSLSGELVPVSTTVSTSTPYATGTPELYNTSLYNDSNIISYYRMEGNSNDAKSNFNGTDTSMSYATSTGVFNKGASFNGSNSKINLGSILSSGNNLWIHGWFNAQSVPSLNTDIALFGATAWNSNGQIESDIRGTGSSHFKLEFVVYGMSPDHIESATTTLSANTWYMWDFSYDSTNKVIKLYINGSLDNTVNLSAASSLSTSTFQLGTNGANNNYWNGYMDDVAFFSRVPTTNDISTLYGGTGPTLTVTTTTYRARTDNGDFLDYKHTTDSNQNDTWTVTDKKGDQYFFGNSRTTTSTSTATGTPELYNTSLYNDNNIVSYYRMEGSSTDSKGNHNGSDSGMSYGSSYGKFGQGADFNGSSGYISMGNILASSTNFWLHGWFQVASVPSLNTQVALWGTNTWTGNGQLDGYITGTGSSQFKLQFSVYDGPAGPPYDISSNTTNLVANTWYMWDFVYDYTNHAWKIYINGSLDNTVTHSSGVTVSSATTLLGSNGAQNNYISGYMDDVAIFSRTPTTSEVSGLYSGTLTSTTTTSSDSRMNDPGNSSHVYRWMLDHATDPNGNEIDYQYTRSGGQIYPSQISYAGNSTSTPFYTIEFAKEGRADVSTTTKTGFRVVTDSRIKTVNIKTNGSISHQYSLGYTTGDNGSRSLLSSVTESGIDENGSTTTLPAIQFTYQAANGGWSGSSYTAPFMMHGTVLADLNGDGYADIIDAQSNSSTTTYLALLNDTNGGWATSTAYTLPVLFYTSCTDSPCDTGARFVDVNGDGLPDILVNNTSAYLNTGSGWATSTAWTSPLPFSGGSNNGNNGYARIGDINGDGLPDIYRVWNDGSSNYTNVYLNTGSGWATSTAWSVASGIDVYARVDTDLNGDGLIDFIQGFHSTGSGANYNYAAINNSTSSWISNGPYAPPNYFVSDTSDNGVRVMDSNGDGLPDLVQYSNDSYGANPARSLYLNNGNGWTSGSSSDTPSVPLAWTNIVGDTGTRLGDINGDGTVDALEGIDINGSFVHGSSVNTEQPVDVLTKITYPQGGSTNIAYKASGTYKDNSNVILNPNLPFSINTVYQIIGNDGTATTTTDTYTYKGGKYYYNNALDRRFAGFNEVDKTDAVGNVMKTFYHQGDTSASSTGEYLDDYYKIGKPYRVEKYDSSGNLFEKTINKWVSATTTNSGFVKLAQSVVSSYDGAGTHKDKAESYTYNNSTGNITQKVEYGEVNGSNDGTFTDTGTDDFTTTYSYATSSTSSEVSLLSDESTVDHSSIKVKETRYYYDNLALGLADKGNLTKKELWKSGSTYINTQKAYNSYGLVTSNTDPRGKVISYTYDTFNLYPTTVTDPLSHATQYTYDYSSGKVKQTTDPNGNNFQNVYDGLDRVIEQKQPDPSATSSLLTKLTITYTDAANIFSTHQTNYLTSTNTVESYTYLDGLGRKKQERTEAAGLNYIAKDYAYNNLGLLQKESLPYFSTRASSTNVSTFGYLFTNYNYDALGRVATSSNAAGTTTYAYLNWKTTVTDPKGKTKDLYKDAYDNLVQVNEHNGSSTYTTLYTYDYLGDLTNMTDAASSTRAFTYDGLGRRLTAQDLHASGDSTYGSYSYTYDDASNLTQKVDPNNQTVNYTYDDVNRPLTEDFTGSGGTDVTYTYDSCTQGIGRLCTSSSTAVSISDTYNALGQLTQESKTINGTAYTTSYTYDRQGNQVTITSPDNSQVQYLYGTFGQVSKVQRKESTDSGYTDVVTNVNYAPTGQETEIDYANGAATLNTYDDTQLYRLTNKLTLIPTSSTSSMLSLMQGSAQSSSASEGLLTFPAVYSYTPPVSTSSASSTLATVSPNNSTTSTSTVTTTPTNTATNTPESAASSTPISTSTSTPDANNNQSTATSTSPTVNQGTASSTPDISTTTPVQGSSTTPLSVGSGFWSKIYHAIASVFSQATHLFADAFSIKTAYAAPAELYNTSLFDDPNLVSYYRMEGNSNDAKNNHNGTDTSMSYNSAYGYFNQGAGFNGSNGYISMGNIFSSGTNFWLHGWFNLQSVPGNNVQIAIAGTNTWTGNGQVMFNVNGTGSSHYKIQFMVYGLSGPPWQLDSGTTNMTGNTWYMWDFVYDYTNKALKFYLNGTLDATLNVSSVVSLNSSTTLLGTNGAQNNFWPGYMDDVAIFNRVPTTDEVSGLYNGTLSPPTPSGIPIQDIYYTYDANGNITQMQEVASTSLARTLVLSYDDLNRLTNASTTAATSTPFNYSYTYDPIGNMLNRTENGTSTNYTYATNTPAYLNPDAVQKVGNATSTYDSNGNLLAIITNNATSTAYTWDYNNRLISASSTGLSVTYAYDPSGERIKQTSGATTTIYSTKYYNTDGTTPTKHIFLNGMMIATLVGTGTSTLVYYDHPDHLTGASAVSNSSPGVEELTDYYPYGNTRLDRKADTFSEQRKAFGHEFDANTGLSYQDARYMDPTQGRFISQDPSFVTVSYNLSDPQSFNAYAYSRDNPIIYIDPTGRAFTLSSVWHNAGGYAYGFGEGAINVVGGTIGYAADLATHPVSTISSTLNTAADIAGTLADFAGNPQYAKTTISQAWNAGYSNFETKDAWAQGRQVGNIFGAIDAGVALLKGSDEISNSPNTQTSITVRGPQNVDFSNHALQRMLIDRNISEDQVSAVLQNSSPFNYYHDNALKTGYYDANSKIFVGEIAGTGKITTVINNVSPNYISNLQKLTKPK